MQNTVRPNTQTHYEPLLSANIDGHEMAGAQEAAGKAPLQAGRGIALGVATVAGGLGSAFVLFGGSAVAVAAAPFTGGASVAAALTLFAAGGAIEVAGLQAGLKIFKRNLATSVATADRLHERTLSDLGIAQTAAQTDAIFRALTHRNHRVCLKDRIDGTYQVVNIKHLARALASLNTSGRAAVSEAQKVKLEGLLRFVHDNAPTYRAKAAVAARIGAVEAGVLAGTHDGAELDGLQEQLRTFDEALEQAADSFTSL